MITREGAFAAIAAVDAAALVLASATALEMELADLRSLVKDAGIARLIEKNVERNASNAEKFIEKDAEFLAHRIKERRAVADRIVAQAKYDAAKLRARLTVELCAIDEAPRDHEADYEIVGEHCPDCNGTGDGERHPIEGTLPCKRCSGKGVLANA